MLGGMCLFSQLLRLLSYSTALKLKLLVRCSRHFKVKLNQIDNNAVSRIRSNQTNHKRPNSSQIDNVSNTFLCHCYRRLPDDLKSINLLKIQMNYIQFIYLTVDILIKALRSKKFTICKKVKLYRQMIAQELIKDRK